MYSHTTSMLYLRAPRQPPRRPTRRRSERRRGRRDRPAPSHAPPAWTALSMGVGAVAGPLAGVRGCAWFGHAATASGSESGRGARKVWPPLLRTLGSHRVSRPRFRRLALATNEARDASRAKVLTPRPRRRSRVEWSREGGGARRPANRACRLTPPVRSAPPPVLITWRNVFRGAAGTHGGGCDPPPVRTTVVHEGRGEGRHAAATAPPPAAAPCALTS